MSTQKPRLYFDLTTLRQNRSTSIQANGVTRTLFETAKRFFQSDIEVTFICHDARENEYVSVDPAPFFKKDQLNPQSCQIYSAPLSKPSILKNTETKN